MKNSKPHIYKSQVSGRYVCVGEKEKKHTIHYHNFPRIETKTTIRFLTYGDTPLEAYNRWKAQ